MGFFTVTGICWRARVEFLAGVFLADACCCWLMPSPWPVGPNDDDPRGLLHYHQPQTSPPSLQTAHHHPPSTSTTATRSSLTSTTLPIRASLEFPRLAPVNAVCAWQITTRAYSPQTLSTCFICLPPSFPHLDLLNDGKLEENKRNWLLHQLEEKKRRRRIVSKLLQQK